MTRLGVELSENSKCGGLRYPSRRPSTDLLRLSQNQKERRQQKEEEKVSAGVGKIFLGETRCDSLSLTRGKIYLVTLKKEITFSLKPWISSPLCFSWPSSRPRTTTKTKMTTRTTWTLPTTRSSRLTASLSRTRNFICTTIFVKGADLSWESTAKRYVLLVY